jgi:hypothetical protein
MKMNQALKDKLKPPFIVKQYAHRPLMELGSYLYIEYKTFVGDIDTSKLAFDIADWVKAAIDEKYERDFGGNKPHD